MAERNLSYIPYPTTMEFHKEHHHFLRALCGPFGSGKSVACVEELLFIGMRQAPNAQKERHVRFCALRGTYPTLKTTTLVDMRKWYPRECGGIKESVPITGSYKIPLNDGTTLIMELILLAVQNAEDVEKLRSLNLTAIWINEATEVTSDILDASIERIGRYPTGTEGKCSWSGILMDYNMPPRGHWLHKLFHEGMLPDGYKLYEQPPAAFKTISDEGTISYALNTSAENLSNLAPNYYSRMIEVRMKKGDIDGIDQLLCLKTIDDKRGKPVWPMFSREKHVASKPIDVIDGQDLLISIDTSGIHPAALFWQFNGVRWCVLDEIYGDGEGLQAFIYGGLLPLLRTKYSLVASVFAVCDPADAKNALTAVSPVMSLNEAGIRAKVARTNNPKARIETVAQMFNMDTGGILISPTCVLLVAACAGGYSYKKLQLRGTVDAVYSPTPKKDHHSHPADALEYGALHIMGDDSEEVDRPQVRAMMSARLNTRRSIM